MTVTVFSIEVFCDMIIYCINRLTTSLEVTKYVDQCNFKSFSSSRPKFEVTSLEERYIIACCYFFFEAISYKSVLIFGPTGFTPNFNLDPQIYTRVL